MKTMRDALVVAVAAIVLAWTGTALAQPFPGGLPQCQAVLNTSNANLSSCTSQLGTCTTNLGTCTAQLAASQKFPASGQTSCWDSSGSSVPCGGTRQDGDIKAGAALSYTSNADGTIIDNNTGLVWEKKTPTCGGDIHCVDDTYTWADAFTGFIAVLNTVPCFAGHCDWRLPNIKELESIVNHGTVLPAVSGAFNDTNGPSGANGSYTKSSLYWTASSWVFDPMAAWDINFASGASGASGKISHSSFVRAVRGGL